MQRLSWLVVLVPVLVLPSTALAQTPERYGLWFGGGAGATLGNVRIGDDASAIIDVRNVGPMAYITMGGTLSPAVLLGVDLAGWTQSATDTTRTFGLITFGATLFPLRQFPFYLKGGLGVGAYRETAGTDRYDANGFGVHLGIGAEFRVASNLQVGPYVQYAFSRENVKRNQLALFSQLDIDFVSAGVGVRWHRAR